MSTLAQMVLYDIYANLPAAGIPGRMFYVSTGTNAGNVYRDSGSAWQLVMPGVGVMVGDSGSGGVAGLVPAPPAGSTVAGDFLRADGTWAVPAGSGGGGLSNFDTPPSSPNAANDEFAAGSLNSAWTAEANTAAQVSYGVIVPSMIWIQHTGNTTYVISKPFVPGASDFAVTAKLFATPTTNYQYAGIILSDTAGDTYASPGSSNGHVFLFNFSGGSGGVCISATKVVAGSDTFGTAFNPGAGLRSQLYLHMQRVSGAWTFWYSFDGISFYPYAGLTPGTPTIGYVTFVAAQNGATVHEIVAIDWIRFNLFYL